MDPSATRQQKQHKAAILNNTTAAAVDFSSQQQAKRKPLTIHPPSPSHNRTTTTTNDAKPRRSSSISSQSSSIFSHGNNGLVSSSSPSFLPSSPLFRSGYNKLGGSAVRMGTIAGSMPGAVGVGVGVGSPFSPFLGQQSPYGTSVGHRGLSSSTLSLLSSHPSSPGASPASGAFFTAETRKSFDMEAIDVSESEGEQDVVASIDGDDESESSGSEEDGDDDLLSISDRDNSDSEDLEDSGVESSPILTYDPIPAASLLSSSAPSPNMRAGRLGLFGGVQQQTYNGDNSRRSQDIGQQDRSFLLQDPLQSHDQSMDNALVPDVHAPASTILPVDKDKEGLMTVSAQDSDDNDNDAASVGSAPSPALSHSTPAYSAHSTTPSSPSLSGSPYPMDSKFIPDSRLPPALSPSSSAVPVTFIPDTLDGATKRSDLLLNEPESTHLPLSSLDARIPASATNINNNARPLSSLLRQNDDEEDNSYETLEAVGKAQDVNTQDTIQAESHSDGYGSLPKYSTYPTATTTAVQQQHDNIQDLSSSSSNSDAVVAELKEVRTILQDLHKRMDRLERSLQATSSSSRSGPQKDKSSSPVTRRRWILSIIKGMATPRRGGGGRGIFRIAMFVLFVGLIVFGGRRRWTRGGMRSLLRMDWATAKQLARSRLSFLERHVSRQRLH
ncbi:hypothetical protein K457DRAFT_26102 [Linnemannia elongata AG-77]|uniref:Uncharacterized protein n=1 Tax=Linnemannia elongata AG-77 TaxID=1314771 RepID=A0A197JBC2_9FUNG|nr:hypothetical protein K457DRAFT_26102 [Linnemannia elongata AG-77]